MNTDKRRDVDLLIEEFWKKGYLTLFRKYGTYLPEPTNVGEFEVDVIARYKDNFAIGITLNEQDFKDPLFVKNKLAYLAQRQLKNKNKSVHLFVGISVNSFKYAKAILDELDFETRKNIKLFQIADKTGITVPNRNSNSKVLFS